MKTNQKHAELVQACLRGERVAQKRLYDLYSRAMYNICLRMVREPLDAEDLLQNAFIDVFTKLHMYRGEATIGAWIKRIVINNCINFLKKKRIRFDEWDERIPEPAEAPAETEYKLSVGQVKGAMMQLPDGYRTVFSLYLLEGYDHKEIAHILQISEATSKSQYSRAKRKLKQILQQEKDLNI